MDTDLHGALYTPVHSATDMAYARIKSWILAGSIPVGARLREERVAERLTTSRTPVREAMLRLYGERFLQRNPDGGFRVAHLTLSSVRDFYELRRALELFAVRRTATEPVADRMPALHELQAEWDGLVTDAPAADPEFVLVDEDFHYRLALASGNRTLADQLRTIGEHIRPVRTYDFVIPGRVASTVAQHRAILQATLAQEARTADLLDAHILESQRVVEAALAQAMERMLESGEGGLTW